MNSDPFLMVMWLLLLVMMGVATLYYRRIRRVREEYQNAKNIVGDVIISFNKQLQRQDDKLDIVASKTELLSSSGKELTKKIEAQGERLATLVADTENFGGIERRVSMQLDEVTKRLEDLIKMQEKTRRKIAELEKTEYKGTMPQTKIGAVIPIMKEKALAPLTETELMVLKILASGGERTGSEVRREIRLTREHTARLMKKLYENGYLERNTQKLPYTYRVKPEMLRILEKAEAKSQGSSM